MLTLIALLLACPPSSTPEAEAQPGHYLASPYGLPEVHARPLAPRVGPSPPTLPLWDLDASEAEVEALLESEDPAPEWARWVAWALAEAQGRQRTAHARLIGALSSDALTAERLAWWRASAPASLDRLDALLDAWFAADSPRTQWLLASAVSLTMLELSCPVAQGPDGACRVAGSGGRDRRSEVLARRDPIALEQAQAWATRAQALQRTLDPTPSTELASAALALELELAADTQDYEAVLAAGMPQGLDFVVEDWRHGAGVPEWEAIHARQLARRDESTARANAYLQSYTGCAASLSKHHATMMMSGDAQNGAVALLRELRLALAQTDHGLDNGSFERVRRRDESEGQRWWVCGFDQLEPIRELAFEALDDCVELGRTVGIDSEILDECMALRERLDFDHPPVVEFGVEPRSSTTVQRAGLVAPKQL